MGTLYYGCNKCYALFYEKESLFGHVNDCNGVIDFQLKVEFFAVARDKLKELLAANEASATEIEEEHLHNEVAIEQQHGELLEAETVLNCGTIITVVEHDDIATEYDRAEKAEVQNKRPNAHAMKKKKLKNYVLSSEKFLKKHLETSHNQGSIFRCEFCSFTCLFRRAYNQHMGKHNSFACLKCGKRYTRKFDRDKHYREKHQGIQQRIQCDVCGFRAVHRQALTEHKRKHTGAVLTCELCTFTTFYRRSLLIHHRLRHESRQADRSLEDVGYSCDFCGVIYSTESLLAEHVKTYHNTYESDGEIIETMPVTEETVVTTTNETDAYINE